MSDCQEVRNKLMSCLDKELEGNPEYHPLFDHLSGCSACWEYFNYEQKLEQEIVTVAGKAGAGDDEIWQRTRERLEREAKSRLAWHRIKYFVSAAAAAVMLLATAYFAFFPPGIPSNLLSAMEKEHISYIKYGVASDIVSAKELSERFRREKLLGENECCCEFFKSNKDLQLKGGRTCAMDKCPHASIYAEYNNTPVSVFIFSGEEEPGLIAQAKTAHRIPQLKTYKRGVFNAVIKLMSGYAIGVISKLNKEILVNMLRNIDSLENNCKCWCK